MASAYLRLLLQSFSDRIPRRRPSGAVPVLIYQMGKVGSSTIKRSLDKLGRFEPYQVHRLNPDNIARVRREHERRGWEPPKSELLSGELIERMIKHRIRLKIITLVREPIGRNFSYYFQNLDKILGTPNAHASIPIEQLVKDFPVEFPYSDDPLTWFDYEFKEVTGIDLYNHRLDMEVGFAEIKTDLYEVLILRTDAADKVKSEVLARFLGAPRPVKLVQANVTARKDSAEAYRNFRDSIRMVPAYLDHMLGSKYSRHFFGRATLDRLRGQYSRTGHIIPSSFLVLQGSSYEKGHSSRSPS